MPIKISDISSKMGNCFIQPCFIRVVNSDLTDKLNQLGYFDTCTGFIQSAEVKTITWVRNCCWGLTGFEPQEKDYIDCGENVSLFLALASLRNDTDKKQWFTDGIIWEMSDSELPSRYMQLEGHKATVDEIINKFK